MQGDLNKRWGAREVWKSRWWVVSLALENGNTSLHTRLAISSNMALIKFLDFIFELFVSLWTIVSLCAPLAWKS